MDIAKSILVATDFSELGRGAVEHALDLANKLDATLHIVSVDTPFGDHTVPGHDRELHWLREQMHQLQERLKPSGRLGHAVIRSGEPGATILLVAQELAADLIVMGTNDRRGFSWLGATSTAASVLQHAQIPVMVIKKITVHAQAAPSVPERH